MIIVFVGSELLLLVRLQVGPAEEGHLGVAFVVDEGVLVLLNEFAEVVVLQGNVIYQFVHDQSIVDNINKR